MDDKLDIEEVVGHESCVIEDKTEAVSHRAFSASSIPATFDDWVQSIVRDIDFPVNALELKFIANEISGYHHRDRSVTLNPSLMNTSRGAKVIPHEIGHGVEMGHMTNDEREELMKLWDVPDDGRGPLTRWRTIEKAHRYRPREAFASYFGRIAYPANPFTYSVNVYYKPEHMAATADVLSRIRERIAPEPTSAEFPDIIDHPHRDAIERMAELGIITGYDDGLFRPQENLTRSQAAVMFNRLLDHINGET